MLYCVVSSRKLMLSESEDEEDPSSFQSEFNEKNPSGCSEKATNSSSQSMTFEKAAFIGREEQGVSRSDPEKLDDLHGISPRLFSPPAMRPALSYTAETLIDNPEKEFSRNRTFDRLQNSHRQNANQKLSDFATGAFSSLSRPALPNMTGSFSGGSFLPKLPDFRQENFKAELHEWYANASRAVAILLPHPDLRTILTGGEGLEKKMSMPNNSFSPWTLLKQSPSPPLPSDMLFPPFMLPHLPLSSNGGSHPPPSFPFPHLPRLRNDYIFGSSLLSNTDGKAWQT